MYVEENSRPLQPLTCEDLRLIVTAVDVINRLDVHDVTYYQIQQFDLSEVSGILVQACTPFRGTILFLPSNMLTICSLIGPLILR